MKLSLALLLLLAPLSACDAQRPAAPAVAYTAQRTFQVEDPAWGIPAMTVRTPAGWGFAGVVIHPSNCILDGHSIKMNMGSRDGRTGIEFLPNLKSSWVSNPQQVRQWQQQGCLSVASLHAADFVRTILPHLAPNARIVSVGDEPELASQVGQYRAQIHQTTRQTANSHPNIQTPEPTVEAARVKIAYERNGEQLEAYVSALTICHSTQYNLPGFRSASIDCDAGPIIITHTPPGQLDALVNTKDLFTMTPNPAWQRRLQQQQQAENQQARQQMQQQNQQAQQNGQNMVQNQINRGNAAIAQSNAVVDQIHRTGAASMAAARGSQNAIDNSAGATAASMGDHNTFSNSNGTSYQLSNQFSHTYQDSQTGDILQTNSAYAPGSTAIWSELTPRY